jgi:hypothetical protein
LRGLLDSLWTTPWPKSPSTLSQTNSLQYTETTWRVGWRGRVSLVRNHCKICYWTWTGKYPKT